MGFENGLRPYTLVDDREYRYAIGTGFPLYPKNFDGAYRGEVTLHEALSNSLNVPSVKVLEYVGLERFYAFLDGRLGFVPVQPYDAYAYGIALGGLETDPLTLTYYFTIFPRMGTIAPLHLLLRNGEAPDLPPRARIDTERRVAEPKYVQLVHAVLSDRVTGVNQFGLTNNLFVNASDYGVKTGTSRDFHDSWVVGYTPEFVVGVWLGNAENESLEQVTGQSGAGAIWRDVMNTLHAMPQYASHRALPKDDIVRFAVDGSEEWGLPEDVVAEHQLLLSDDVLIQSPHNGDVFEYFEGVRIPFSASHDVTWLVNGEDVGTGEAFSFAPKRVGTYEVTARDGASARSEIVRIEVLTP